MINRLNYLQIEMARVRAFLCILMISTLAVGCDISFDGEFDGGKVYTYTTYNNAIILDSKVEYRGYVFKVKRIGDITYIVFLEGETYNCDGGLQLILSKELSILAIENAKEKRKYKVNDLDNLVSSNLNISEYQSVQKKLEAKWPSMFNAECAKTIVE